MVSDSNSFDELPDDMSENQDDAQLGHLLKSAFTAPELSHEFGESLGRKLDREFANLYPADEQSESLLLNVASQNGTSLNGSIRVAESSLVNSKSAPRKPRTKLRLAVTLAAAASLLVTVSIWNSRPAYGWAAMMRALEKCDWVQAVAASGGTSGWISSKQGVVAVQAKGRAFFSNERQQVSSTYLADEQAVRQATFLQQKTASGKSPDWETKLLLLLMQQMSETHSFFDSSLLGIEVVDESWRSIENKNGTGKLIELRVTLKPIGDAGREFELVFLLDPETQLPVACRLGGEESSEVATYDFTYPEQGPTTIFALGVPAGTQVINAVAPETSLAAQAAPLGVERLEVKQELAAAAAVKSESPAAGDVDSPLLVEAPLAKAPLADEQLVDLINTQLADYWQSQGIHPAEPASDSEFLRRVYLDLTGRIPMVSEVYQFLENTSEDRRVLLVDDLLASRDHATHLAAIWRTMLLPEGVDVTPLGGTAKFDQWLADQFDENLPYDQLVSRLLLAEGRVKESGPLLFYATLKLNPEEIAAKTSRVFLGSRMECAQCHDHPFDNNISQLDFWGFAAFFAQISRPLGKMDNASPVLRVKDNRQGEVMLPESEEVVLPKLPNATLPNAEELASEAGEAEDMSRRRQLVDWLVSHDNAQFSRAAVNRVWEILYGRGIIDPVDDMRADIEPSVPGILEPLSRDFTASGFDLRRLLRAIVLSDSYQLSSQAETDDPSQTLCFARMNMKSLTASQLYDCIAVATRREEPSGQPSPDGAVLRINNSTREAFINQFRAPPGQRTDYQAGIPQALTLMHGQLIHQATDLASSGLLKSLGAPFFSDEQRVETLFLATLSRLPEPAERQQMAEYVSAVDAEDRQQALGDVLWALLNSAEFTFNH